MSLLATLGTLLVVVAFLLGLWALIYWVRGRIMTDPTRQAIDAAHMSPTHLNEEDGGWYFWDETWADRLGPYPTKQHADDACSFYAWTALECGHEAGTKFWYFMDGEYWVKATLLFVDRDGNELTYRIEIEDADGNYVVDYKLDRGSEMYFVPRKED